MIRDCAFVVDVSGTVLTPFEQVSHEVEQDFRRAAVPDPAVAQMLAIVDLATGYARTGKGWDAYTAALEQVKPNPSLAPALFIDGAEDEKDNAPVARTVARFEAFKPDARSGDVTLRVFPGLGHGLIEKDGWVSREFLRLVSGWITARTRD